MKIEEAIKFIVNQKNYSILTDSKKFCAYLKDLSPEYTKELKILNIVLDNYILDKIFSNERENIKIARIKEELEDKGLSNDWIFFIINSFGNVLGWNLQNIKNQIRPTISQQINYIGVKINTNTLKELGYEINDKKGEIFKNNEEIHSLNIPKTYNYNNENYIIVQIEDLAFYDCSCSLQSITIPDSITKIGNLAFYYCSHLQSITIPENVTEIGECAFAYCKSLQSISIPNSIAKIGNLAFYYCSNLQSITIPENSAEIGECAFAFCESLKSITIPKSVTKIGEFAFLGCESLESITIPENVTEIGDCAFNGCKSLKSITIPDSVTKIGEFAFCDCKSLESIIISNNNNNIKIPAQLFKNTIFNRPNSRDWDIYSDYTDNYQYKYKKEEVNKHIKEKYGIDNFWVQFI